MKQDTAEQSAIRCRGLSKHYGQVQAVQDLDLDIPYGSIFGFVGRNGAGKTTTIRLLAGLAQPSTGTAHVTGIETTNGDSRARHKFGYLPQQPAFYNWMTPREYLNYVGRIFGLAEAERKRRVEEMLRLADLQEAARRRIGGFSGGMLQRLGLAQAFLHQPPVLLLDEPTSSLDPAGRYEVLDLIANLRGRATVFFSSHILADVERICDTIGVIHKGQLLLVSDRDELLQRYEINAAVLRVAPTSYERIEGFAAHLQTQPWVTRVGRAQDTLRVAVNDLPQGKSALWEMIVQQGLVLTHYEWVRPTLEDIFMEVSDK
ncbi:MAG: ABC transporter ATP-binding protein [Chloroflexia bacterium]|nr:ABC transporter ATP-binding protein [Chloroflexia bacterium]